MAPTPEALYVAPADGRNLPLPDELYEIREQIKRLTVREAELRSALLADPALRNGAGFIAEIKTSPTTRTDLKELRACHPDLVDEFTHSVDVTRIELSAVVVTEDGELVSARKLQREQAANNWLWKYRRKQAAAHE